MTTVECPRCGRSAPIEELEPSSSDGGWMHCSGCDHVWRRQRARVDDFSLIIGNAAAGAKPVPGRRPSGGPVRALRFDVNMSIRFRQVGDSSWKSGTTVNMSQTGMLVRVERPAPVRTVVEVLIELPADGGSGGVDLIRCEGEAVRSVPPVRPGAYASMGIAVDEYRITDDRPASA